MAEIQDLEPDLFDDLMLDELLSNAFPDADGALDHDEACDLGTDPCNPDTDGDGVLDGADDLVVAGTATEVARQSLLNLCPSRSIDAIEQRLGGDQDARGAVAAL